MGRSHQPMISKKPKFTLMAINFHANYSIGLLLSCTALYSMPFSHSNKSKPSKLTSKKSIIHKEEVPDFLGGGGVVSSTVFTEVVEYSMLRISNLLSKLYGTPFCLHTLLRTIPPYHHCHTPSIQLLAGSRNVYHVSYFWYHLLKIASTKAVNSQGCEGVTLGHSSLNSVVAAVLHSLLHHMQVHTVMSPSCDLLKSTKAS